MIRRLLASPTFVMSCVAFFLMVGTTVLAFELEAGAYIWVHLGLFGALFLHTLSQIPFVRAVIETSRSSSQKEG